MGLHLIKRDAWIPEDLKAQIPKIHPHREIGKLVQTASRYLPPELAAELVDRLAGAGPYVKTAQLIGSRWRGKYRWQHTNTSPADRKTLS